MQHCTDETTDKEMSTAFSPMAKEICSKRDIQKTATGYVSDSVCGVGGVTMTSHSEITGDFNSAYTVKSTVAQRQGPGRAARCHLDDRGEVARRLQARPEARRHRDARRLQDEHQGRGQAEEPAAEIATVALCSLPRLRGRGREAGERKFSAWQPGLLQPARKCGQCSPRRTATAAKPVSYTGIRTAARRPPIGLSPSVMSPPCERAMSRAMARPSPVPPSSWLRASSSRRNGLNTSSRMSGGMPGPSSSTVTVR